MTRHFARGLAWTLAGFAVLPAAYAAEPVLEEIVVTAQRRAEKLQDVPISAQVVGGEALIRQNLNSLVDMAQNMPSVHIGAAIGRSNELYIRGIGSGNNQSFEQAVGMFIDDIYHGRSRINLSTFLDLDRVEVLKGPQSTFFGNNAIAGAFNIQTKKPGDVFEASLRALYGEDGRYAVEGAAGGPINDVVGVRAAATANGIRGWLKNSNVPGHAPKQDNLSGRVTTVFTPNDNLDVTLKIEGGRNRDDSGLFKQLTNCPPPAPYVTAGFCAAAIAAGQPIGLNNGLHAENAGQLSNLDTFETVLSVNYDFDGHIFTSVSGFNNFRYKLQLDADGTVVSGINPQIIEKYHQYSQEFRLASPTGETIEYLAGAYVQSDTFDSPVTQTYHFLSPTIRATPPFAALIPFLPLAQTINYVQDATTYSLFGSVSFNATEQLKLSAGLRGSWVEKDYTWELFYGQGTQDWGGNVRLPAAVATLPRALNLGTPGSLSGERADNDWMPSVQAQYKITPDAMVYASYTHGFLAGGFNAAENMQAGVDAANMPFEPEHVDAYEAGIKSELLNNTLLLNAAVFRSDYSALQVSAAINNAAGTFISLVRNAAQARSQGVELEMRWAPIEEVRVGLTGTYLDSQYRKYPNVIATTLQQRCRAAYVLPACAAYPNPVPQVQDLSDRPTQYAPKWSGNAFIALTTELGADYVFNAEANAFFSTRYHVHPTLDPLFEQSGYVRLDGRLTVETADGQWGVDLIGKNLNNRQVMNFGTNVATSLGSTIIQNQQPRNFALQVRYRL